MQIAFRVTVARHIEAREGFAPTRYLPGEIERLLATAVRVEPVEEEP